MSLTHALKLVHDMCISVFLPLGACAMAHEALPLHEMRSDVPGSEAVTEFKQKVDRMHR